MGVVAELRGHPAEFQQGLNSGLNKDSKPFIMLLSLLVAVINFLLFVCDPGYNQNNVNLQARQLTTLFLKTYKIQKKKKKSLKKKNK